MAIDTTELGDVEYPGEEEGVASPPPRAPWLVALRLAAAAPAVGDRRRRPRLPDRPLARQRHRQRVQPGAIERAERRGDRARPLPRRRRLDDRHRRNALSAGQVGRAGAGTGAARKELGPLLPDDRGPQGRRLAVRGRSAHLPLHRRAAGDADPHRAAQSHHPHLRAGHLHRDRERARHDHDDDGLLGRGRTARQLARPADDRLASHGLPAGRGVLLLDLHGRLPGHPERTLLWRVPDRLDRVRTPADPGGGRDGLLSGRLRGDRDRHDPGRVQPGGHHHQLPGTGNDLGTPAHLRLGHPRHHRTAHPRHAHSRGGHRVGTPRPHCGDRVLRERARREQLPVAEPLLVLRPPRGLHHGPAGVRDRDGDHPRLHPKAPLRLQDRGRGHARRRPVVVLRVATPPLPERDQSRHASACSC